LSISSTVAPAHAFPVLDATPIALSRAAIASNESRLPPRGLRESFRIKASVSASPGFVPNGFRPSHRPVSRRLRIREALSLATMTLFSNCATAPRTYRIKTRVASSSPAVKSVP
jgi:hypothetical protein